MSATRIAGLAGFAMLLAMAAPARAQLDDGPPGPGPSKTIKLPCCRCADERVFTVDISTGAAPWRVQPPGGPSAGAVPVPVPEPVWTTALAPARWIHHPTTTHDPGTYVYELRFQAPNCVVASEISVRGDFSADNEAVLRIDTPTPSFTAPGPFAYTSTFPFLKTVGIGMHSIKVTVVNREGPTGLLLKGAITIRCPRDLEHD
jgi:hypothetical protein